jgi:hypothetical protein
MALWRVERKIKSFDDNIRLNRGYAGSWTGCEALFAHYERYDTRMLDCTHVLQVAASFAMSAPVEPSARPAVVYALDVRRAKPRPALHALGRALVSTTAGPAALRPIRQAAWVIWQHGAGAEVVDFGDRLRAAFVIEPEDRATFWDSTTPHDHRWLMQADQVAEALRQP